MKFEREDMHDLFVLVVNTVEPEHPYKDNPYPITKDQVEFGWCQSTSWTWARCGPRNGYNKVAGFSCDIKYFNKQSLERILTVMGHEVTHITEGSHTDGSVHNQAFWREMVFNCTEIMDNVEVFEDWFGEDLVVSEIAHEVIDDPNASMVDRRTETVEERKQENRELVASYL